MSIAEKLTTIAENTPKVYTAVYEKCKAEAQELLKFADTKLDKPSTDGTAGQVLTLADDGSTEWTTPSGGGGSVTSNYLELENKPSINNIQLSGNVTTDELGIKNGVDGIGIASIVQQGVSSEDNGKNYITATLTDGTQSTFIILNGSKGSNGDTPIKGVDYYTEDDKNEIVEECSNKIIETGNIAEENYAWYENSKSYIMSGTYTLFSDVCVLKATANLINGWKDIYYSLPVAFTQKSSIMALTDNYEATIISTNTRDNISVIQLSKYDGQNFSGGNISFVLIYKYK